MVWIVGNSLYPAVQASLRGEEWPLGAPDILVGMETSGPRAPRIEDALGLWRVRIRAPRQLHFPIIPFRHKGRLYFPLCPACVQEGTTGTDGLHSRVKNRLRALRARGLRARVDHHRGDTRTTMCSQEWVSGPTGVQTANVCTIRLCI